MTSVFVILHPENINLSDEELFNLSPEPFYPIAHNTVDYALINKPEILYAFVGEYLAPEDIDSESG